MAWSYDTCCSSLYGLPELTGSDSGNAHHDKDHVRIPGEGIRTSLSIPERLIAGRRSSPGDQSAVKYQTCLINLSLPAMAVAW